MEDFKKLTEKEKDFFRHVMDRLGQAKRKMSIPDKVLDLVIALETVLLREIDDKQQLGLTFRLRGSWLLANDLEQRKRYYYLLKELYGLRSNVAHTGKLPKKYNEDRSKAEGLIKDGFQTASEIIMKIMKNGWPNWDDVVLGIC